MSGGIEVKLESIVNLQLEKLAAFGFLVLEIVLKNTTKMGKKGLANRMFPTIHRYNIYVI